MSDANTAAPANSGGTVTVIYILYLVGLAVGITSLIAVVMAYINRGDGPEWTQSHYTFQIRTFWIGLLYGVIGVVLLFVVIGWLVLVFSLVWMIVRCVKGLKFAGSAQPYPTPGSWLW
ncbi:MAG: hypothetical protein ABSA58_13000 [Acetobacteraceae bacterium]|jgi:uncharacterized membrane protein